MKMLLPSRAVRKLVTQELELFYSSNDLWRFTVAVSLLVQFYKVKMPVIEWVIELDSGASLGKTNEDGVIQLIIPGKHWLKQVEDIHGNSPDVWIKVFFHEWWHYMVWVDEEEKADEFAEKLFMSNKETPNDA